MQNSAANESDNAQPARKGRPRSSKSHKAIQDATMKLLLHSSVQELSIEAIAKKAGVGKTTIYRWWPNKTAVVMDALTHQPGWDSPIPTSGNAVDNIQAVLTRLIRLFQGKYGRILAQILSEAQADDQARAEFERAVQNPQSDRLRDLLEQGQETGLIRTDIDTEMLLDMLLGPIFYRLLTHPDDLNDHFQAQFPGNILSLIAA